MHDLEKIIRLPDLEEDVLVKIFQNHFGTKDLQIIEAGDRDQFSGKNDFYNSEIRKAKFRLRINGEEKEVNAVLKTQLDDNFHKISAKFTQPFTKEAFWYNQASKELGKVFPAIKGTFLHPF